MSELRAALERLPRFAIDVENVERPLTPSPRGLLLRRDDVLAALSSKDEPLDVERLAAALHDAGVDCNPLARVDGPFGDYDRHMAASRHRESAEAVVAALSKETPA